MEEIKLNVQAENGELIIRSGEAPKLREPEQVSLMGTISAVSRFLANRFHVPGYDWKNSRIEVNREDREIRLVANENSYYRTTVTGRLIIAPEFERWEINTGRQYEAKELAEFVKMNRSAFQSKSEAMQLSTQLSNLKIKTDKELEKADNNRGEMRYAITQKVIEMNIPDAITLSLPLFKGERNETFKVEIYVNPSSFEVSLVSPEAQEYIQSSVNRIIDEEIVKVNEVTKDEILIIEQ